MSAQDIADWQDFRDWSRLQLRQLGGIRPDIPATTDALLRNQWDFRPDKKEYIILIRRDRVRKAHLDAVRRENFPGVKKHTRYVRRAMSRSTAVALQAYVKNLRRLEVVQNRRNRRGNIYTSATIIRHHDRLMRDLEAELDDSKQVADNEATMEMCRNVQNCPNDLLIHVLQTYDKLPWGRITDDDATDRDVTEWLAADIRTAQTRQEIQTIDWASRANTVDLIADAQHLNREGGDVCCDGHLQHTDKGVGDEPLLRTHMSEEWRIYLEAFKGRGMRRSRKCPVWVIEAAKARAEMLWDHTGTAIYPPELDHSDLYETLFALEEAEDEFYANPTTKPHHVPLERSVAQYKNTTIVVMPQGPPPPTATPTVGTFFPGNDRRAASQEREEQSMLDAGRRALQHAWSSVIRQMILGKDGTAAQIAAAHRVYLYALQLFDSDPEDVGKARVWLSPTRWAEFNSLVPEQ